MLWHVSSNPVKPARENFLFFLAFIIKRPAAAICMLCPTLLIIHCPNGLGNELEMSQGILALG